MQTLVRVVVALVIVLLLLVVVLPLQLISMLVENDPESESEPENESKSADDLEPGRPDSRGSGRRTSASVETPPRIRSEAINTR